jgi:hypothetical protein
VVKLLLVFWSRKELDLAHGNCPYCTEEDMAALLKPLAFALVPHNPSASQQVQFSLERL